jgi:hypothetical protein
MNKLKNPDEYLPQLEKLRKIDPYAKNWKLSLMRHTNRHRETNGGIWGWYEVHPLSIEVGYFGTGHDDLKAVDINDWNKKAEAIS